MTDGRGRERSKSAEAVARARGEDEAERALGRAVATGLPIAGAVGALAVGWLAGFGSAVLVLAACALLGAIALLWASVRTLSGDAPLPSDLESLAARRHGVDPREERKRRVFRALKDLENERTLGKIDEADYAHVVARYREEAKAVLREMELELAPVRAQAEKIARDYLVTRGVGAASKAVSLDVKDPSGRLACPACAASNEPDAAFCKGCGSSMTKAPLGKHAKA